MATQLLLTADTAVVGPGPVDAVHALRAARRTRRLGDVSWGDLAYRVYTTALASLVLTIFASGLIGDSRLSASQTAAMAEWGPRWVGLGFAVCVAMAVRSGRRGGPLALERADVHHLLMAPVDRSLVLRRPAVSFLGYSTAAMIAIGGLAGELLSQRMAGSGGAWILSGAIAAGGATAGVLGAGMLTESRAVPKLVMSLLAVALIVVAGVAIAVPGVPAPTTYLAEVVFWPLHVTPASVAALVCCVVLAVVAVRLVGGLDMEAAMRRSKLVGQLRFAVTQQDMRSVVLLRRQLASEVPRRHPWFPSAPGFVARRAPVAARDLESLARWPIPRIARVVGLVVAAGFTLWATYSGTTPLILVAGVCTYVAALDAIEPLAQELDHPTMVASYPIDAGRLRSAHLSVPMITLGVVGLVATAAVWAVAQNPDVWVIGIFCVISGSACAVAGACASVLAEDPSVNGSPMSTPEVAGPRFVFRTLWPPFLAIAGLFPVVVAQRLDRTGQPPMPGVAIAASMTLVLAGAVFVWVRVRDEFRESMNAAMGANNETRRSS